MTVNIKPTGRASSMPAGLAWGGLVALGGTLLGTAFAAKLIDAGRMSWNASGYAVMIILVLSAWIGATTAAGMVKRQRLMVCLSSGVVYFSILMILTGLFFGGQYSGVGETALLILCGSMFGILGRYPGKTRRNVRKTRVRNR